MSLPGNGIFVVQGEMWMLVTAMRRSTRWGSHSFPNEEYDVLMRTFQDLKTILNQVEDLRLLDPATYLSPFLEVIRSKETTGPVTSLALSAIHKFLSYGLIDPTHPSVPATVEDIADAVTHARFVGTDHSSDGVVLMKILQVLRTLMLSPEGAMLTDESVCEIMLSCFRICFETRLTELLRRNAEQCLRDMTQLIFMRLPQFPPEDAGAANFTTVGLSLKKREKTSKRKNINTASNTNSLERKPSNTDQPSASVADNEQESEGKTERHSQDKNLINEAEITIEPVDQLVKSPVKKHGRHSSMDLAANGNTSITQLLEKCVADSTETPQPSEEKEAKEEVKDAEVPEPEETPSSQQETTPQPAESGDQKLEEYVNHRGIRFTPQEEPPLLQPYGLVCVRELFRFLISLCNPLDAQNTSAMVHLGLCLVGTALEVGADQIANYPSLLYLVKDPLCRNLLSLLDTERISIFALDLQVSFLLFEALRFHLKFQMEAFFKKIIEIISTDTTKAIYELKEIHHLALESLAQMFRIPGLCAELYLNYDCDIYCMNVFEEITKLLSKNVVSSTAYNIHTLSLEALLTIIEAIEIGSQAKDECESETQIQILEEEKEKKYGRGGHVSLELGGMDESAGSEYAAHDISEYFVGGRMGRHKPYTDLPTEAELDNIRNLKKWVTQGTELFNQKPERGIEFLQEHGVLKTPLDPREVALFLRENPDLDKKMIGEYICKRSSRGEAEAGEGGEAGEAEAEAAPSVLGAFADSFDYTGLRIDQALRLYLETFRLPGEAPLIFLVMERFADRWHSTNGEPFANTDAAFRLAYAVIMLNMDQHNHNAKKLNVPMTVDDFVKNLRGCNGSGDFDQAMLEAIFHSIKNEEMVMPAERVGPVREAYLWRVLQRRGAAAGRYTAAPRRHHHHARLFAVACPPTVSALSAAFERAPPPPAGEAAAAAAAAGEAAGGGGGGGEEGAALAALRGLQRCAALQARLPCDTLTLDTLLLTLCKFSGLLAHHHASYVAIGVSLGQSAKAQLALQRACAVAARHADCVRSAWRHLLDILAALYVARLLPKCMVEVEDYLAPGGRVALIRATPRGSDTGLLSSIYSYIALGETGIRAPTPHEKALIEIATECVAKCNLPSLLVTETKFLQVESLQELIRAMIAVGTPPDPESLQMNPQLEEITIFFLELLGQTLIQNRDRLQATWEEASAHITRVVLWAATAAGGGGGGGGGEALRRAVTALLRTAARLMRCDQAAAPALHHLRILFQLPYKLFYHQAEVISCGLYELVKTSAQNVHSAADWDVVFALLCAAGAGAWPRDASTSLSSASSRSEDSEDESERRPTSMSSESELSHSPQTQGWILVKNEPALECESLEGEVRLRACSGAALARCCEALALVVRDVAHVTPYNCRAAVRAVRLLAAAAARAGKKTKSRDGRKQRPSSAKRRYDDSSDEELDTLDQYHLVSIQLLDLMHTLHSRTAQIFKWWRDEADQGQGAEEYDLWEVAWMPLLQGIAEFCTDRRKQVANSAIAYLQRALLVPGLAGLAAGGWEACFQRVLFPLLERLLRRPPPAAPLLPARANTIMCKVFLQHLAALSARASFAALWARVLELQRALLAPPAHDALTEAALEALKNMLLVMDSVKVTSSLLTTHYSLLTTHSHTYSFAALWARVLELQRALLAPPAHDALTEAALEALKNMLLVMDSVKVTSSLLTTHYSLLTTHSHTYSFAALWARVLELQRALLAPPAHDALTEAALEALKNMLLVMDSVKVTSSLLTTHYSLLTTHSHTYSFAALWARVLELQRALLAPPAHDALTEAALEALKNMLLVMDSVKIFSNGDGYNDLWYLTWDKIGEFLPNLKEELFPEAKDNTKPSGLPSHMQPTLPPTLPTLVPVGPSTPTILPVSTQSLSQPLNQHLSQHSHILTPPTQPSHQNAGQPFVQPSSQAQTRSQSVHSPINLSQTPPSASNTSTLVTPTPISGMVPIRNPLYDQTGLTSSVLLQPLNEMISTPIGISIQSQIPILYPRTTTELIQTQQQPDPLKTEPTAYNIELISQNKDPQEIIVPNDKDVQHSELYAEYLTNPYNDVKEVSPKEATLYDPESLTPTDQTVPDSNKDVHNPLLSVLDKQKSFSANTTPMHSRNKTQFSSTDNVRADSSIFNFTSYFGSVNEKSAEVFDVLMSSQEG
ncbi:Golgi-specific brefeldin A-resistance guanine nucleotide exchange factor 1 [Galleria mellonella]|uniref:Golgi-specific brefeldin A-resistance guanine nucleotide exchange factor 1 n=1 Tax=Galleria mellonella TaxID=7137 RepID=A0ABM3MIE6_GALME|nr:Golgi-specific brefeldin A-resistance guanine nucleotide exchange factor 1 [Galleria mellonella]